MTEAPRPPFHRWLAATVIAWISAPLFSPGLWMVMPDGADDTTIGFVLTITYFVAAPYATAGVAILLMIWFFGFRIVARWTWWVWALLGGACGYLIMAAASAIAMLSGEFAGAPPWFHAIGIPPGLMAALIFRYILLHGAGWPTR